MSDDEPQETTDVSDLIQNERVRSITDSRHQVIDVITTAEQRYTIGEISRELKNAQIAQAVDAYIRELGYLFRHSKIGQPYWEETEIGTWEVEPPEPWVIAWQYRERTGLGRSPADTEGEMPRSYELVNKRDFEKHEIQIEGLQSFVQTPVRNEIEYTAEFRIEFHDDNPHEVTGTIMRAIPEDISKSAYLLANDFCGQIGLDVQLEDDKPPAKI